MLFWVMNLGFAARDAGTPPPVTAVPRVVNLGLSLLRLGGSIFLMLIFLTFTGGAMADKKPMKAFDASKPYATVYGHLNAKFEQNGILYGGSGQPVDASQLAAAEDQMAEENRQAEDARKRELQSK